MRSKNGINLHWISEKHVTMILQIMRQRRIDRGALTLASAEVKFQIDTETHDPLDIGRLSEWLLIIIKSILTIHQCISRSSGPQVLCGHDAVCFYFVS